MTKAIVMTSTGRSEGMVTGVLCGRSTVSECCAQHTLSTHSSVNLPQGRTVRGSPAAKRGRMVTPYYQILEGARQEETGTETPAETHQPVCASDITAVTTYVCLNNGRQDIWNEPQWFQLTWTVDKHTQHLNASWTVNSTVGFFHAMNLRSHTSPFWLRG